MAPASPPSPPPGRILKGCSGGLSKFAEARGPGRFPCAEELQEDRPPCARHCCCRCCWSACAPAGVRTTVCPAPLGGAGGAARRRGSHESFVLFPRGVERWAAWHSRRQVGGQAGTFQVLSFPQSFQPGTSALPCPCPRHAGLGCGWQAARGLRRLGQRRFPCHSGPV